VTESPVADGECAAIVRATRRHCLLHALDARYIDRLSVVSDFTADTTHGLNPYQVLVQRLRNDVQVTKSGKILRKTDVPY
jgi:lipopolysaccharide/colanic/teichoic acid biosynthesis glycosyltransferase